MSPGSCSGKPGGAASGHHPGRSRVPVREPVWKSWEHAVSRKEAGAASSLRASPGELCPPVLQETLVVLQLPRHPAGARVILLERGLPGWVSSGFVTSGATLIQETERVASPWLIASGRSGPGQHLPSHHPCVSSAQGLQAGARAGQPESQLPGPGPTACLPPSLPSLLAAVGPRCCLTQALT